MIGFFNHINRLADALGIDLEPDMPPHRWSHADEASVEGGRRGGD